MAPHARTIMNDFWERPDAQADLKQWFTGGDSDATLARRFNEKLRDRKYAGFAHPLTMTATMIATARNSRRFKGELTRNMPGRIPGTTRRAMADAALRLPPRWTPTESANVPPRRIDGALVTLRTLEAGMCRYPHGDPREKGFHYCGHLAEGEYCAAHRIAVHQAEPPSPIKIGNLGRQIRKSNKEDSDPRELVDETGDFISGA